MRTEYPKDSLIVTHCDNRGEWLEERRKSVGASEMPTLFGVNPWQTPLDLYLDKTGQAPPREETFRMKLGHRAENMIASMYAETTQRVVHDPGDFAIFRHKNQPLIHATFDRTTMRPGEEDTRGPGAPLQLKLVGSQFADEWAGAVPIYVQMQVQAEIWVSGLDWGSIAALIGMDRFVWQDVERHNEFAESMLAKVDEFMTRVHDGNPPEATAQDVDGLRALYPEVATGKVIDLPSAAVSFDQVRQEAMKDIARAEATRDWATAKLMELMGDAEKGVLPNGGAYMWKMNKGAAGYTVEPKPPTRVFRRTSK